MHHKGTHLRDDQVVGARVAFKCKLHWCCFVDHQLETSDVDALEFVQHLLQCLVEFKVFSGFDVCNFVSTACLQTSMNDMS